MDAAETAALFAETKTHSPFERIPGPRWLMQKRQLFPELWWASPSRVALPRRIEDPNGSATGFWNMDQIPFRPKIGVMYKLNAERFNKASPKP